MENIIYNELLVREFDIDVGVVEYNHKDKKGKKIRSQLEIDFILNINGVVTAIEVKSGNNKQSKSLNSVVNNYKTVSIKRPNQRIRKEEKRRMDIGFKPERIQFDDHYK